MYDLADYKRTNHKKNYVHDFPKGILDVIEADYPNRYFFNVRGSNPDDSLVF
ncbi:hypothetical protein UF75_1952 [Desulfosporosinus sp. I2]|uniref:hypothetical protein n=1 Tax=Desulfosporosinus sp. I2 TaxID=1617025 RepID=UPI00061E16B8|nr:hypothetical protein [Desulfosporosinus sp. I2]KJR47674.1 hypothetical protein UF75_1952 [Desulfosporosinus sp. I2]